MQLTLKKSSAYNNKRSLSLIYIIIVIQKTLSIIWKMMCLKKDFSLNNIIWQYNKLNRIHPCFSMSVNFNASISSILIGTFEFLLHNKTIWSLKIRGLFNGYKNWYKESKMCRYFSLYIRNLFVVVTIKWRLMTW